MDSVVPEEPIFPHSLPEPPVEDVLEAPQPETDVQQSVPEMDDAQPLLRGPPLGILGQSQVVAPPARSVTTAIRKVSSLPLHLLCFSIS